MNKKKALERLLLDELKSKEHVIGFVKEWKVLDVNVGDIYVIDK